MKRRKGNDPVAGCLGTAFATIVVVGTLMVITHGLILLAIPLAGGVTLYRRHRTRQIATVAWQQPYEIPAESVIPIRGAIGEYNSRAIPQDVKVAVAARDRGRCVQCSSTENLHFDHKVPWSRGGANTVKNIQLLCGACNWAKGARL